MTKVRLGKLLISILILTSTLFIGMLMLTAQPVKALTTLPSDMPVVFVDPQNKTAGPGDNITISVKVFNLTNRGYLGGESLPLPPQWEWGEPLPPPGHQWNYSLGNLYGIEINFDWDENVLAYVSHTAKYPVETFPDGIILSPILEIEDVVDIQTGTYALSVSSFGIDEAFNKPDDNATIFEMTFNVLKMGRSHLNITMSNLAVGFVWPRFSEFFAQIPHHVMNGQFQTEVLATHVESLKAEPLDNGIIFRPPIITGESAFLSSTIINDGNMTDYYNLTLYWGTTLLRSWLNETLDSGERKTFNYTIDGTELPIGSHTTTARVSVLYGGFNFTDEIVKPFSVIGLPQLNIIGPDSATAGDTIDYTTNSNHTDPTGEILNYTWTLWREPETAFRQSFKGETTSFELEKKYSGGNWTIKLSVRDSYGMEYDEDRPATAAYQTTQTLALKAYSESIFTIENIILVTILIIVIAGAIFYLRRRSR